jgi:hypothetical protein
VGNVHRDLTLASQVWFFSAASRSAPWSFAFDLRQRSACTISSGYVDAMKICASSASG